MERNRLLPIIVAMGMYAMGLGPALADDDSGGYTSTTVFVQTVKPVEKTLPHEMITYGTVIPDVGSTVHMVLPRPGQVTKLAVSPGQEVHKGQNLFEFSTGAAALLAYQQAASTVTFARADLSRTQELFKERLATKTQLAASEKALSDAEQALQAQEKIGAGKAAQWVVSPGDAVVTEVTAKVGERMDQGGAVLQLAQRGAVEVDLGVEPEQLSEVHPGMPVALSSVFAEQHSVSGKISGLHGMIDPQTRLVDAVVRLDGSTANGLLPGMQVKGVITLAMVKSWVMPRQAVLTDGGGAYVFQISDGKAVRVPVKIVLDMDDIYGVQGQLDPKAALVTTGNYELSDGQLVRNTDITQAPTGKAGAE